MSIAIATKGRLWPSSGALVIREQVSDIGVEIVDPFEVSVQVGGVVEIGAVVELDDISVTVESEDSLSVEVASVVDVSSDVEEC